MRYQTAQGGIPTASAYMAAGGFSSNQGGFGQAPQQPRVPARSTMKVTRDGEIVMSEEELELQREMYRKLQTQSGKAAQPKPPQPKVSGEKLSFDHGFGRFDTAV